MFNPKSKKIMKNSIEIAAHTFFWGVFVVLNLVLSKIYLQAVPDAPFAQHLSYVIFLELVMGLILFYTTYFAMPWAQKKQGNLITLSGILLAMVLIFAYPATHFGIWQVLSSLLPHLLLIFLAFLFRRSFRMV
jgi:uncharacterized membrane protein